MQTITTTNKEKFKDKEKRCPHANLCSFKRKISFINEKRKVLQKRKTTFMFNDLLHLFSITKTKIKDEEENEENFFLFCFFCLFIFKTVLFLLLEHI